MLKKFTVILMALIISACSLTACTDNTADTTSAGGDTSASMPQTSQTGETSTAQTSTDTSSMFAEGDTRDVLSDEPNATITLSGSTGTLSDTTRGRSGSEVTITSKGVYEVTGSSEDVTITVNDSEKSGNVYLILSGVTMTNSAAPCIYVENSEKVIIVSKGDDNTLTYTAAANSEGLDGAVYAEDDVTFSGSGSLAVSSKLHGVVCKNDLKITGSALSVEAGSIGLKANDSVRIGGGTVSVTSGHDGIQVQNKAGDSFFYMESGELTVDAGYDGIDTGTSDADFTGSLMIEGGLIDITSGGGSDNAKNSDQSQKGIKCDGDIIIENDASVVVSSADDAVNCNANVTINGGETVLSTSDDGITADGTLTITDGTLTVEKSYEALEAADITIDGGTVSVTSTDDGINAGGGSDSTSEEQGPMNETSSGMITINGGDVYVNATGDGIDSNGSIVINGGYVIVEGPTDAGNGALDKGDGSDCRAEINGGTVLAIGSTGMAVNFDSGTQCSALVSLSGEAGTKITVDDGSDFSFTTAKSFECVVYSSDKLSEGSTYTITAGSNTATADFTSGLYYTDVTGGMGGNQGPGGR